MLSGLWRWQTLLGGAFWMLLSRLRYFIYKKVNDSIVQSRGTPWGRNKTWSNHVGLLGYLQVPIPPNLNQLPVLRWWVVKISPLFGCATGGWSIIFVSFVKGVYFKHWSTSQWDQHVFFIFGWLFNSFVFWTCIWVTWSKPPTIANHPMVGFRFPVQGG